MTLSIKNNLNKIICNFNKIRFNVFYVIMKGVQLLQILNNLYIRDLIKLILHENDVKLLKYKGSPV